ncbi:MAG: iron ABC transporter permease [Solobacterium sp.]|nr:iron ABC transporter permease [Solobacterium sp.]
MNGARQNAARHTAMPDRDKRPLGGRAVLLILCAVLLLAVILSFTLGRYPVGLNELQGILRYRLGLYHGEPFWTQAQSAAVWNIRLPRVLLAVLVGASLASAGAAFQGAFQNPMASPDILGASAGACFGAALAIFFGFKAAVVTASAFFMSMVTVGFVFFVSRFVKGERVIGLILSGIMISSLFQAGTSFIKLAADPGDKLPAITYWLMGSLVGAARDEVTFVFWPMLAGFIPLILLRWRLNVVTMGDDDARSMGVHPGHVRLAAIASATLLTAASVSVSGMIGWVGLVIPHMMRRLTGSDHRFLIPASALGGGLFLLIVDDLSRSIFPGEIPIGILTAFIGAPFFLLLITRRSLS